MEVSKRSLSFRWLQRIGIIHVYWDGTVRGPQSLCTYFWATAFTTVIPLLMLATLGAIMATHWKTTLQILEVLGIVAGASLGIVVMVFGVDALGKRGLNVAITDFAFAVGGSMPVQFLVAKKKRLCPILKFTDGKPTVAKNAA